MREQLIQLLSRYFDIGDSYTYNLTRVKSAFAVGTVDLNDFEEYTEDDVANLADYLIDNGVIVLPCKIGDAVYSIEYQGCAETCTECDYYSPYEWGECDKGYSIHPRIDEKKVCPKKLLEIIKGKMSWSFWEYNEKHFGKTVFLTREAAEAALKARENECTEE